MCATATKPVKGKSTRRHNGKIGYIYLRVSDARQVDGSGLERQKAASLEFCKANGLRPEIITDEGRSAYHEDHIKRGGMGQLLTAIDEGRVAPGNYIIVESFDRVSRAGISALFTTVMKFHAAGLTAVTLSDGALYPPGSTDRLDKFLTVGMVGSRSNEESSTKGIRVTDASEKFCKAWIAKKPTEFPKLPAGSDPVWVTWNETAKRYELNEKAETVSAILQWFNDGYGLVKLVQRLEASGLPPLTNARTQTKAVRSLLHSSALTGVRHVTFGARKAKDDAAKHRDVTPPRDYPLLDYYPRLLSDAEFSDLQRQLRIRAQQRRKSKSDIPSILTGIGLMCCGYCQRPMGAQNAISVARNRGGDASVPDTLRRAICLSRTSITPCPVRGTCSVAYLERALMEYCSNSFNLKSLLALSDRHAPLALKLKQKQQALNATQGKLAEVTEAMKRRPLRTYEKLLIELEDQEQELQREIDELDYQVRQIGSHQPANAEAWDAVRHDALALDPDARMKARRLVEDTFEKIDIYVRGFDGETRDEIGIEAHSKAGQQLMLTIDRRTGEWKEGALGELVNLSSKPRGKSARAAIPDDTPIKRRRAS